MHFNAIIYTTLLLFYPPSSLQSSPRLLNHMVRQEDGLPETPFKCGELSVTSWGHKIGRGVSTTIYTARIDTDPTEVAVKFKKPNPVFQPQSESDPVEPPDDILGNENARKFLSGSEHVMKVYGTCKVDDNLYIIVQSFLQADGASWPNIYMRMRSGVYSNRQTREDMVKNDFLGLLSGIAYIHSQHCIHGDINKRNTLIVDGAAVIVDLDTVRTFAQFEQEMEGWMTYEEGKAHNIYRSGMLLLQMMSGDEDTVIESEIPDHANREQWMTWLKASAPAMSDELIVFLAEKVFGPVEQRISAEGLKVALTRMRLFRS